MAASASRASASGGVINREVAVVGRREGGFVSPGGLVPGQKPGGRDALVQARKAAKLGVQLEPEPSRCQEPLLGGRLYVP